MWRGHEEALATYGLTVCTEWVRRGHPDTCAAAIAADLAAAGLPSRPRTQSELARAGCLPGWLGDQRVHASHRSALLRKDEPYYRDRLDHTDPDLPYFWPVERG